MRRIDSFYTAKPTLAELYAEDAQLFSGLSGTLPTDGSSPAASYGLSDFVSLALVELGELQTIFPTAAALKSFLSTWGKLHYANWTRMQSALNAVYNPIHNYDRTEEEIETVTTSSSESASGMDSTQQSNDSTEYGAGFNSASSGAPAIPVRRDQSLPRSQSSNNSESTVSGETGREREVHISGNIGVTTSQQMLEAEVQLRDKFALYYIILDEFRREICVEVW